MKKLTVLTLIFLAFMCGKSYASDNNEVGSFGKNFSIESIEKAKGKKNFGIGIRGGDPSGLSLKKYMGKNALELTLGRTFPWNNWNYDRKYKGKGYYKYHYYKAPLAIQLHYLFHKKISGISGLDWYYGLGAQTQFLSYYAYYRQDKKDYWVEYRETNIGMDLFIGLEYTFTEVPISLFTDLNAFVEITDDPFYVWLQGGAGIRLNF